MIFLQELPDLKISRKKFFLPINMKNKRFGSVAMILGNTPLDTNDILSNELLNVKYYESYYIEKDITLYTNNEGYVFDNQMLDILNENMVDYNHIINCNDYQEVLSIKENCKNMIYTEGLPKYLVTNYLNGYTCCNMKIHEMNKLNEQAALNEGTCTADHDSAGLSKYIDGEWTQEMEDEYKMRLDLIEKGIIKRGVNRALNKKEIKDIIQEGFDSYNYINDWIKLAQKAFQQDMFGEFNKKYNDPKKVQQIFCESSGIDEEYPIITEERIPLSFMDKDECLFTDEFVEFVNENGSVILAFNDTLEVLGEEADPKKLYSNKIYKLLYANRYRTPKEVLQIYKNLKEKFPIIKYTYLSLNQYKKRNLFIDLSYYNNVFLNNNSFSKDKAVDYYYTFLKKIILDKRIENDYDNKTIIIPIDERYSKDGSIKDKTLFNKNINIVSVLLRQFQKNLESMNDFRNTNFLFLSDYGYFKVDFSKLPIKELEKFRKIFIKLVSKDPVEDEDLNDRDSSKVMVANVVEKIEKSQGIKIHNLTGDGSKNSDKLVKELEKAANKSNSEEELLDNIDNEEYVKKLISAVSDDEDPVKISAARKARITSNDEKMLDLKIKGKSIRDMLNESKEDKELPVTSIKVDTINKEWENLQFINFESVYDLNADIVQMLKDLAKKKYPISIINIDVSDTSTSEDYIETWTVKMEDALGQRFSFVFDIPKIVDKKYMKLRGNRKTISGQLVLIPVSKTDQDTVQIVSNYKKIFIRSFGLSSPGKSYIVADKIIKTLSKNKFKNIKITYGNNKRICKEFELPLDYIDLSSVYSKIETSQHIIYFNQNEIDKIYHDEIIKDRAKGEKGVPIAIHKSDKKIVYWNEEEGTCSSMIKSLLTIGDSKFGEEYDLQKESTKYYYSQASILASKIPLIIVLGYNEGLTKVLDKSGIKYDIYQKKPNTIKDYESLIRFSDGYIKYENTPQASMLMNGLKECDTANYSLQEINKKSMFLDFLDQFGGRILADGLDNFYEQMIDSITREVLERYKLPTDYVKLCLYANDLLVDNKYIKHTNLASNRYRRNEIIAGYFYLCLSSAYGNYMTSIKKGKKIPLTMKQSAVIDAIMADPTFSDKSLINELKDAEDGYRLSTKGLSGMNSDRSYSLDKRTFNKSMLNVIAMSTSFAGNVGVNRQGTIDMNIEGKRGYIKIDPDPNKLNVTKSLCFTEALNPFITDSDDPFRESMGFIQSSEHTLRVKKGMPNLISNGADMAMPYFTSNTFAFKAAQDGEVAELTDDYMILKYKDGTAEYIDLRENSEKNSNGGSYIFIKLIPDVKLHQKIKANQIVAYDEGSYSKLVGYTGQLAYSSQICPKVAIPNSDEGFEDSTIFSHWFSDAMSHSVGKMQEITLDKDSELLYIVKKGQYIKEGEPLVIYQKSYDDADVNALLKNLSANSDTISELGRIPIHSHVEGEIADIKIYRTVDKDELSDSLKKLINSYEKPIKETKKVLEKYNITTKDKLDADYKLEATGKLKNVTDGIKIEIKLKYDDKLSIGDKIVNNCAVKGVSRDLFPEGLEPTSEYRPDEPVDVITSILGISARIVTSIIKTGGINKFVIELSRKCKEMAGMKWKDIHQILDEDYERRKNKNKK